MAARGGGPEKWISQCLLTRPDNYPAIRPYYSGVTDEDLYLFSKHSGPVPATDADGPLTRYKFQRVREMIWRASSARAHPVPEGEGFWQASDVAYVVLDHWAQVLVWNFNEVSSLVKGEGIKEFNESIDQVIRMVAYFPRILLCYSRSPSLWNAHWTTETEECWNSHLWPAVMRLRLGWGQLHVHWPPLLATVAAPR